MDKVGILQKTEKDRLIWTDKGQVKKRERRERAKKMMMFCVTHI